MAGGEGETRRNKLGRDEGKGESRNKSEGELEQSGGNLRAGKPEVTWGAGRSPGKGKPEVNLQVPGKPEGEEGHPRRAGGVGGSREGQRDPGGSEGPGGCGKRRTAQRARAQRPHAVAIGTGKRRARPRPSRHVTAGARAGRCARAGARHRCTRASTTARSDCASALGHVGARADSRASTCAWVRARVRGVTVKHVRARGCACRRERTVELCACMRVGVRAGRSAWCNWASTCMCKHECKCVHMGVHAGRSVLQLCNCVYTRAGASVCCNCASIWCNCTSVWCNCTSVCVCGQAHVLGAITHIPEHKHVCLQENECKFMGTHMHESVQMHAQ